jgi:hypothetical protein
MWTRDINLSRKSDKIKCLYLVEFCEYVLNVPWTTPAEAIAYQYEMLNKHPIAHNDSWIQVYLFEH